MKKDKSDQKSFPCRDSICIETMKGVVNIMEVVHSELIPSWMKRFDDTGELIRYLRKEGENNPSENVYVKLTYSEAQDIRKKGVPLALLDVLWGDEFGLKGSPIMLALLFGEFESAERILGALTITGIRSFGRIQDVKQLTDDNSFLMPGFNQHEIKKEIGIENLLYIPELSIPKALHEEIFTRITESSLQTPCFLLPDIRKLGDKRVREMFVEDYKRNPDAFRVTNDYRSDEIDSLPFLLKVYRDDRSAGILLKNTGYDPMRCSDEEFLSGKGFDPSKRVLDSGEIIGRITELLREREGIHSEYFSLALRVISALRKVRFSGISEKDMMDSEEKIWEVLKRIPYKDLYFEQMVSCSYDAKGISTEAVYEFAYRMTGKKKTLIADGYKKASIADMLHMNPDLMTEQTPFRMFNTSGRNIYARVFSLLGYVDRIEYERIPDKDTLLKVICNDREEIKDLLPDLLEKGLIPRQYTDYLIKNLRKREGCEYMLPLLISLKWKEDTKIFAILAKGAEYTFIWITPDMVGESWVTDLRMRHGFDLFAIGDVPDTYYDEVLSKLIEDGGFVLDEGLDVRGVVRVVRKLRGGAFAEEDLKWMIGYAGGRCNETRSGKKLLTRDAFDIAAISKKNALSRLEEMPGLSEVKTLVMEQVALLKEAKRNDKLSDIHSNMLFFGNPGTGKTTCGKLLSEIMADKGISNPCFIEASRADIIGQFVGSTAQKTASLFERARGGVLFVDEAGFFLNTDSGGFVNEAIKEFVRFMEAYPDVTVIFAMYKSEADLFLQLDAGLSSRISAMIEFRDYTDKELSDIFEYMVRAKGYKSGAGAGERAINYIESIRGEKNFGNAREVRKIVESSVIAHAVRIMDADEKCRDVNTITFSDVKRGIERIRHSPKKKEFGFAYTAKNQYSYA